MIDHQFHFKNDCLPIVERIKTVYKKWLMIYRNIPKCERYGLGAKIDALFLELLDTSQKARYLSPEKKIPLIEDSLSYIDSIKFFIQYAWEAKIISEKQFADIGQDMEDIGRMTGGWRRGLLTKTSDHLTEEKK